MGPLVWCDLSCWLAIARFSRGECGSGRLHPPEDRGSRPQPVAGPNRGGSRMAYGEATVPDEQVWGTDRSHQQLGRASRVRGFATELRSTYHAAPIASAPIVPILAASISVAAHLR